MKELNADRVQQVLKNCYGASLFFIKASLQKMPYKNRALF